MGIIATGYLQIETLDVHGEAVPYVMIRIYKEEQGEILYEDYVMTDKRGHAADIALYTPSQPQLEKESTRYHLTMRRHGYEMKSMKDVPITADTCLHITAVFIPEAIEEQTAQMHTASERLNGIEESKSDILNLQKELQIISRSYQAIPYIDADGIYGCRTSEAVAALQQMLGISESGTVDKETKELIDQMYGELTANR